MICYQFGLCMSLGDTAMLFVFLALMGGKGNVYIYIYAVHIPFAVRSCFETQSFLRNGDPEIHMWVHRRCVWSNHPRQNRRDHRRNLQGTVQL